MIIYGKHITLSSKVKLHDVHLLTNQVYSVISCNKKLNEDTFSI